MNTGRHVRERHRKTKSWFTLLECCLFHQDKGNNLSTPWAGLDNCLPKRLTSVYMCSFSIYNIPPFTIFFSYTFSSPCQRMKESSNSFPAISRFQRAHHIPVSLLLTAIAPQRLGWLRTKCTSTPQWLTMVQMWGRIKKLGRQMLWANRAAADWAKATRHSKALNTRSDRSNCSNGVISTVDLRLPGCLAQLTGTQSINEPTQCTLKKAWFSKFEQSFLSHTSSILLSNQTHKKVQHATCLYVTFCDYSESHAGKGELSWILMVKRCWFGNQVTDIMM